MGCLVNYEMVGIIFERASLFSRWSSVQTTRSEERRKHQKSNRLMIHNAENQKERKRSDLIKRRWREKVEAVSSRSSRNSENQVRTIIWNPLLVLFFVRNFDSTSYFL